MREFVIASFKEVGTDILWKGTGIQERGIDKKTGRVLVEVDKRYFRPTEVDTLLGDARKAKKELRWKPRVTFKELVAEMVREDLKDAERDQLCKRKGYKTFKYHE